MTSSSLTCSWLPVHKNTMEREVSIMPSEKDEQQKKHAIRRDTGSRTKKPAEDGTHHGNPYAPQPPPQLHRQRSA